MKSQTSRAFAWSMKGLLDEELLQAYVLQVAGVSAAAVGFGGVLSACAGGSNAGCRFCR